VRSSCTLIRCIPIAIEQPETTKNTENEEESDAVEDEEIVRLQKQKDRERFASLDEEEQERYGMDR
jgi:hypothetical protein